MASAKDVTPAAPAENPKLPRRCAKCATPKPDTHYKTTTGASPYCTSCRVRFPSIAAARIVAATSRPLRKR